MSGATPRRALVITLLLAVASVAWYFHAVPGTAFGRGDASPGTGATSCVVQTVEVVAAPDVSTTVRAGAAELQDACLTIRVIPRATAEVAAEIANGARLPAVWVPDTTSWQNEFLLAGVQYRTVDDAFASTPVVLVGGPAGRTSASWGAALRSGQVALPDPLDTTVGAMTLVAPRAEGRALGRTDADSDQLVVPLAQEYGERRAEGETPDIDPATIERTERRVVPVTERAYLSELEERPDLRAVVPGTGAPLMRFAMVLPAQPTEIAGRIAAHLEQWIASEAGRDVLRTTGLRTGKGEALRDVPGLDDVTFLPTPRAAVFDDRLHSWKITSVPSSLLAVFDVSGSMDFAAGVGQTRMELSVGVAETALGLFPDHARIGLWAFSIDQGGPGQDWRVLEPIRRLDARTHGVTQRQALLDRSQQMLDLTSGGTGLYDTTLAAYQQALKDYDEDYYNSVILLTDGANDDPGSPSLETLLRQLRQLKDPQRPIRIIGVAISADADLASLSRIAKVTGGKAYAAKDPRDILGVFAQALLDR